VNTFLPEAAVQYDDYDRATYAQAGIALPPPVDPRVNELAITRTSMLCRSLTNAGIAAYDRAVARGEADASDGERRMSYVMEWVNRADFHRALRAARYATRRVSTPLRSRCAGRARRTRTVRSAAKPSSTADPDSSSSEPPSRGALHLGGAL
jgi:hypothetical protein